MFFWTLFQAVPKASEQGGSKAIPLQSVPMDLVCLLPFILFLGQSAGNNYWAEAWAVQAVLLDLVPQRGCEEKVQENALKIIISAHARARAQRVFFKKEEQGEGPRGRAPLDLLLNDKVYEKFHGSTRQAAATIQINHRIVQSVGATGGVHKGQGRNQHKLMIYAY